MEGHPLASSIDSVTRKVDDVVRDPKFCFLGIGFHFLHPGQLVLNNDFLFIPRLTRPPRKIYTPL